MKYIRTYETEEKFLTDKDSTSRGFRLKPTLYKHSDADNGIYLELDDPRKYKDEGSTYMEITLDSDVEFSFYIGNAPDNTETTMDCRVDWGDGTVDESLSITADSRGFKLSHNYKAGSYSIELHKMARDYSIVGKSYAPLISHPSSVKRVILGEGNSRGVGGVVSIGASAFYDCSSLTSIYIPKGVTSIGENAFFSCISLTSINIPEGVTSIGENAFFRCTSLTSINIPESVTSIEFGAFTSCTSLTSVYIPNSVTLIDEGAFRFCSSLTSVTLPNNATISSNAFENAGLSLKTTIDGITYAIGSSNLTVGNYTFSDIGLLTFYVNGNSYYSGDSIAVDDCDKSKIGDLVILSTVSYNDVAYDVTSIKGYVFYDCTSLTSINIPGSVNSIGEAAFFGCTSLTSISSFNPTTPTLGSRVFNNIPKNGTLHVKPGATGYDVWLDLLPEGWTIVEDL